MGTLLSTRTSMAVLAERYEPCVGCVTVRCERCCAMRAMRCERLGAMRCDVIRCELGDEKRCDVSKRESVGAHGDARGARGAW